MAEITNHVKYYLYVLSPHRIKYYVCVVCLHIMLGMISMFYVTTERLPTNSGCSQHPCHPIEAVSRRVCFHFVHPPNSLPFFSSPRIIPSLFQLRASSSRIEWDLMWFPELYSVSCLGSLSKNYCLFRGMFRMTMDMKGGGILPVDFCL